MTEFGQVRRGGVFMKGKLIKNGYEDMRFMVIGPGREAGFLKVVVLARQWNVGWKVGQVSEIAAQAWPVVE